MIRRELWEQLGGLDVAYYPAYYEDADLCLRAAAEGFETWYQPRSRVRHIRSASTDPDHRAFVVERSGRVFLDRWRQELQTRAEAGETERAIWLARRRPLRVLVIDDRLPDPGLGSGFGRMCQIVETLAEDPGLALSFHPVSGGEASDARLGRAGVRIVLDLWEHLETPGVEYDVVVISRPHNAQAHLQRLAQALPAARFVYDNEAFFYRRMEMEAELAQPGPDRSRLLASAQSMRAIEQDLLQRVDVVVCASPLEADLAREVTDAPVHVSDPWLSWGRVTDAGFDQRADIGLVAGWLAGPGSPNSDGLRWFATQVLPRVRTAMPGCRLLVTGAEPPADVVWLSGPAVQFVGRVADLADFYNRIRVAISPTRFGAGIKVKTVEAVQHGVPVVCTTEAAGGLPPGVSETVTASDDPQVFAHAVITLLRDRSAWQRRRDAQLAAVAASRSSSPPTAAHGWQAIVKAAR